MRAVFALLLVMICCGSVFAESQPPTPSASQGTAKQQEQTKNTKAITVNFKNTTSSSISPSSSIDANAVSHHGTEHTNGKPSDWWLIFFTGGLVVCAFFQYRIMKEQATRLRETVEATEKAAKAAQDSATFLPMIERAYVFVTPIMKNGVINICLENHGKTPAILIYAHPSRVVKNKCPDLLKASVKSIIPDGIVIGSGSTYIIDDVSKPISDEEWESINYQGFTLYCYGIISYRDVIGKTHETSFCWEFITDTDGSRFNISDSKLNYYT